MNHTVHFADRSARRAPLLAACVATMLIAAAAAASAEQPERTILKGAPGATTSFAFSPDGARVASTSLMQLRVWDAKTGDEVFHGEGRGAAAVAFSPDGKRLAAAWNRGHPVICDAENGDILFEVPALDRPVSGYPFPPRIVAVAFSHDGRRLATAGSVAEVGGRHGLPGGVVKIWDLETRGRLHRSPKLSTVAAAIAFSPDGKLLAVGTSGAGGELPEPGRVSIWDTESGERPHTLQGKQEVRPGENHCAITALAFSPDSKRLAWGDTEGTVRVCDLPAEAPSFTLSGQDWVGALAFSPRGDLLASGGDDGAVWLWDTATGKLVRALEGHSFPVRALAFNADGTQLECACGATSQYAPGIAGLINDDVPDARTAADSAGEVLIWDITVEP